MKIIVAGSRTFKDYSFLERELNRILEPYSDVEVVSGGCVGVDSFGEQYARENGLKVKVFPADWKQYGLRAGPVRNKEMAEYANGAIVFWDGVSKGSKNMIGQMERTGKPVMILLYKGSDKVICSSVVQF